LFFVAPYEAGDTPGKKAHKSFQFSDMRTLKLFLYILLAYVISPDMAFPRQCLVFRPPVDFGRLQIIIWVHAFMSDFNGDDQIDFDDFFLFADVFGQDIGEKEERERFDFDGDGRIFYDDFLAFADSFGRLVGTALKDRVVHLTPDRISIGTFDTTRVSPTLRCIFTQLRASKSAGYYYSSRSLKEAGQPFANVFITADSDSVINTLKTKWSVSGPDEEGRYTADLPFGTIAELSLNRDIVKIEDSNDIQKKPGERTLYKRSGEVAPR